MCIKPELRLYGAVALAIALLLLVLTNEARSESVFLLRASFDSPRGNPEIGEELPLPRSLNLALPEIQLAREVDEKDEKHPSPMTPSGIDFREEISLQVDSALHYAGIDEYAGISLRGAKVLIITRPFDSFTLIGNVSLGASFQDGVEIKRVEIKIPF